MKLKAWMKSLMRKRKRVYIMPTKMGGYLNGLIFLMFLLSVGYSNNLLLIFTLVLFGLNLVWVLQTHSNLQNLSVLNFRIINGHADDSTNIYFKLNKTPENFKNFKLTLEGDNLESKVKISSDEIETINGEVVLPSRGEREWNYLLLSTDLPFGLYQVWLYHPLKVKTLVYPALLKDKIPNELNQSFKEGDEETDLKGAHGFRNLAPYDGEESRKISWKYYARSGELFIREGEKLRDSLVKVKLELPVDKTKKERVLSELATRLVSCHLQHIPFTFESESKIRGPGFDHELLQECLKDLGRC